jgi:legumain
MQYGNTRRGKDLVFNYMGTNPANDNFTFVQYPSSPSTPRLVTQRDADLLHFWHKVFILFFIFFINHLC